MTTWLQHVKKVHAAGNTSFKESLKRASASWKKGGASKPAAKGRKRKQRQEEEKASTEEQAEPKKKKKRRRRVKQASPDLPEKNYKNIDSRSLR